MGRFKLLACLFYKIFLYAIVCTFMPPYKIILIANTDWYLYNFRLSLAKFLREEGFDVVLVSPSGKFVPKIQAEGFRWVQWNVGRQSINPFYEINALLNLVSIYREEKPSLIHLHTIKAVLYGSVAAWLAGIPAVVRSITGRGYVFLGEDIKARILRPIVKSIYRFSLHFPKGITIFENETDRAYFVQEKLVDFEDTTLIKGVGVDTDYYVQMPEPEGVPVIVLASRMLWDKGVGDFVEAARLLKGEVDARYVLVGEPDEGNPANIEQSILEAWEREGIVEWHGWQDDMRAVFSSSHIVVLPSFGEGVPTVLLEAAACGRPIIATDVPGCRDVVQNNENGLLVPVRNPTALSVALKELVQSSTRRQEMGAKSRILAEKEFSITKVALETLDIYLQIFP